VAERARADITDLLDEQGRFDLLGDASLKVVRDKPGCLAGEGLPPLPLDSNWRNPTTSIASSVLPESTATPPVGYFVDRIEPGVTAFD
jgi:hypothetical protein